MALSLFLSFSFSFSLAHSRSVERQAARVSRSCFFTLSLPALRNGDLRLDRNRAFCLFSPPGDQIDGCPLAHLQSTVARLCSLIPTISNMPHHSHLRATSPAAGQLQRMHRRHRQPTPKGLHRRQGTLGDGEDNEELLPTATRPTPSLRPGREGGSPADLLSSLFSEGQAAVTSILGAPQDEASPFGSLTRCSQGCFDGFFPSDCRDDVRFECHPWLAHGGF